MKIGLSRILLFSVALGAIVILSQFVYELKTSEDDKLRGDLQTQANDFTHNFRQVGDEAINHVRSIGAFLESSQSVSEYEFSRFVIRSHLLSDNEHLRAVGVIPILERSEISKFNAALKDRQQARLEFGYLPFSVKEDPARDIYMPVTYVESISGRDKILGYDIATSPERLAAAQAALLSAQPHITPPIILTQDDGTMINSILILSAIKNGGDIGLRKYKSANDDRTSLIAASYSPEFAIKRLLDAFDPERRLLLKISDVTDTASAEIFSSEKWSSNIEPLVTNQIVIGNRVWAVSFYPSDLGQYQTASYRYMGLGAIGALLILALALALDRVFRHQSILAKEVEERTEQLNAANTQLAQSAKQASKESDAKSMFLAHMSHELRTPLNAVIGYAQMLNSEIYGPLGDDRYSDYARTIENAGNIQLQLVEDILSLTAIQGGNRELRITKLDLPDLAEQCVDLMRTQIDNKGLKVDVLSLMANETFYGDRRSIQQIIINLLSNAIKFTPKEGEINIRLSRDNVGATSVSVSDNGIGIAPQYIDKVLQPFGQAHVNPYNAHEGVGLGLSIVTGLAEVNGGTVRIESAPDKGTTVTIFFPAERDVALRDAASGI